MFCSRLQRPWKSYALVAVFQTVRSPQHYMSSCNTAFALEARLVARALRARAATGSALDRPGFKIRAPVTSFCTSSLQWRSVRSPGPCAGTSQKPMTIARTNANYNPINAQILKPNSKQNLQTPKPYNETKLNLKPEKL